MTRTIRAGPRPFIALGIVFGIIIAGILFMNMTGPAHHSDFAIIGVFLSIYAGLSIGIWKTHLVVNEQSIILRPALGRETRILFEDIRESIPFVVAEPQHPVTLHIIGQKSSAPVLSIRLKPYREEDVAWLLQLPGLKVKRDA